MVKKKSGEKISKKRTVKRVPNINKKVTKKIKKKVKSSKVVYVNKNKINFILSRLIFFIGLALISFVLYFLLNNEMFDNLFLILTIVFGFIAVGFLIVLLIFLILKILRK